ncbi:MAG: 50S ribosomal protein L18 [Planctomycetales bacterium]|nr:50S ribosomal protein L18 [Planctomycetales bacterium]
MNRQKSIQKQRERRRHHVRNRLRGDSTRPRLSVYRSNQNISAQIIDDLQGKTLCSASTRDAALRDSVKYGGNVAAAALVGKALAEKALEAGVKSVSFDRGCYKFHGRVKALAEAAREAGLEF